MEIQDIAKKTPGSRALFNYISNKQRNCRSLDLERLTEFFRLDDKTVLYEDVEACCRELASYGFGRVDSKKFICLKPLQTLSLKPWVRERRRPPRHARSHPRPLLHHHKQLPRKITLTLGDSLKVEIPVEKTREIFEMLRKLVS